MERKLDELAAAVIPEGITDRRKCTHKEKDSDDVSTASPSSSERSEDHTSEDVVDRENSELSETLSLPIFLNAGPLEGVKSKKRPVLAFRVGEKGEAAQLAMEAADAEKCCCPALNSCSRMSITGMSLEVTNSLLLALSRPANDYKGVDVWRHDQLRVGVLHGDRDQTLLEELEAIVEQVPHVICMLSSFAVGEQAGLVRKAFRDYKGALLLIEDAPIGSTELAKMFHYFGITTRWCCKDHVAPVPVALPKAPKGKMLEDFKYRQVNEDSSLLALVAQVQPLYDEHFHADLLEDLKEREGCMVTFLVADEAVERHEYQAIGFIVYKFWGAPLRSMSILRVAVFDCYRKHGFGKLLMQKAMEKARKKPRSECAKVTLHGVPEALRFYERLKFTPIPEENLCDLSAADVDTDITPLPGAVWMEYKCGREYKPPGKRR